MILNLILPCVLFKRLGLTWRLNGRCQLSSTEHSFICVPSSDDGYHVPPGYEALISVLRYSSKENMGENTSNEATKSLKERIKEKKTLISLVSQGQIWRKVSCLRCCFGKGSEEIHIGFTQTGLLALLKKYSLAYWRALLRSTKEIYMYQPSKLNGNLYSHFTH